MTLVPRAGSSPESMALTGDSHPKRATTSATAAGPSHWAAGVHGWSRTDNGVETSSDSTTVSTLTECLGVRNRTV